MICTRCNYDPCQCHRVPGSTPPGQTVRVNRCDVPGCARIVSTGDPVKNGAQGLRLPCRCRFHRDPRYQDPPKVPTIPVLPDHSPFVPFSEIRMEFDRIRQASGRALRAYWAEQGITVRPPSQAPRGWSSIRTSLRHITDKWFPPLP